jgi:hypothetical protein
MKNLRSIFPLAIGAVFTLASCTASSHIEVAQGVNFSNYKTFAWANDNGVKKSGRVDNEIVDNNIKNAIGAELEKKGWQETEQQPDVVLDYTIAVDKGVRKESEPVYSYPYSGSFYSGLRHRRVFYYNPGYFRGYRTYNIPFTEGTLTINMTDAKNNKLIWQGWSTGDLASKNVTTKDVKDDVKSIFKKFNFPKTA